MSEIEEKELAELISEAQELGKAVLEAEKSDNQEAYAESRLNWYRFAKGHRRNEYYRKLYAAYYEASV